MRKAQVDPATLRYKFLKRRVTFDRLVRQFGFAVVVEALSHPGMLRHITYVAPLHEGGVRLVTVGVAQKDEDW